ncbi:MAG: hypothetical protein H7A24_13195 [Leptospiraceae bacterium]|nr:hypothetical protein [Leptospiraceae bacterium]MCP5512833.1 hypothetical protein [Leptospiraceae bacterium]
MKEKPSILFLNKRTKPGMKFIVFSLMIFLLSMGLSIVADPDQYFNEKVEKLWDLDGKDKNDISIEVKTANGVTNPIPIYLSQFKPLAQEFQILPQAENTITGKYGTEITIPANAISLPGNFRKGDIIILELIEVINPLDFITSGVDLTYTDARGKNHIFESGGMFKINASYYSRPLRVKKGAQLQVKMPILRSNPGNMKVFRLDPIRDAWSSLGDEAPVPPGGDPEIPFRYFSGIPDFEWHNFDYPNPNTGCITGEIEPVIKNPPYTVIVTGMDFRGATVRNFNTGEFAINTLKDKNVKIIVMDDKGNLGKTDEIKVSTKEFFLTKLTQKSECMNIGTIKIEKIPPSIRQNRGEFLKYIGLKDDISP